MRGEQWFRWDTRLGCLRQGQSAARLYTKYARVNLALIISFICFFNIYSSIIPFFVTEYLNARRIVG